MTFKALSILALVAPLACATIVLQQPNDTRTDSPTTITWTSSDNTDPPLFSLVLQRESFHNTYAIANNVPTTDGTLTITIPTVPVGDGYSLQAVNISNINDIYSSFGPFSIGAALSTTGTSTATGSGTATLPPKLTGTSGTGTATGITTTGTGATVSTPNTVVTTSGTTTGTQTSTTTATPFNNGAKHAVGSYAALALSALAGITFLAL